MNSRSIIFKSIIVAGCLILATRLFYIQILDANYQQAAQKNVVQKTTEYPYRGLVTDRNNNLLVFNTPVYDLLVVPGEVNIPDTLRFIDLLKMSREDFDTKMSKARRYSRHLPSVLIKQIANDHMAEIQSELIDFEGFYIQPRTVREYGYSGMSHVMGYMGEVNRRHIERDTTGYYRSGDYIGLSGVEKEFEPVLRGERGVSYQLVDVQRVAKGKFRDGEFDTLPVPGAHVQLTLDLELQKYAESLMKGKIGSVVAIEPKTGEILVLVSAPDYDPSRLSGKKLGTNYGALQRDSLKPLFNRALQAKYPPGSMFKTIQSLISLQEGIVTANQQVYCKGNLIGDHAPPGHYDVKKAIQYSSNNYYHIVFRRTMLQNEHPNMFIDSRIGLNKWRNYVMKFGLGNRLGVDLPNEGAGFVPTVDFYDRMYGTRRWKFSTIASMSIGQGELGVTPLQMANLAALLANRGYYYTPHVMRSTEKRGKVQYKKHEVGIDSVHYQAVLEGMELVVTSGSGRRAYVKGLGVCGKTSTVENPGKDHSGFMAFAPIDDPKIAIAVYVENAGWGARAAAATAGLVIEKYLTGEVNRKYYEKYVLKGNFHDPR